MWRLFKDVPIAIKAWIVLLGGIFAICVLVLCVIPLAILLIAFPKLWILIAIACILLIIGYFKGR
jgi:hypothetical protein